MTTLYGIICLKLSAYEYGVVCNGRNTKFTSIQNHCQDILITLMTGSQISMPTLLDHTQSLMDIITFLQWSTVFPDVQIRDISSETVKRTILGNWIAIFEVPHIITRDRGPQFQSILFHEFINLLVFKHIKTTIIYVQTELWNPLNWFYNFPLTLFSIWNIIKEDLYSTPSEMVFGT